MPPSDSPFVNPKGILRTSFLILEDRLHLHNANGLDMGSLGSSVWEGQQFIIDAGAVICQVIPISLEQLNNAVNHLQMNIINLNNITCMIWST